MTLAAGGMPTAAAQGYPAKPVRLVVPYTPGGSNDVLSRAVGARLADLLGQPVVIDNRPGAGGMVGAEHVMKSAPDGYTLLNIQGSFATNAAMRAKMPYDPVEDYSHIAMMAKGPLIVLVHPSMPVKTVKELVAVARSRPGDLNYGSSGTGGITHLAGESLARMAGIRIAHVPYKGISLAITDLMGGHVQLVFTSLPSTGGAVQSGRLRLLAVTSAQRFALVPGTPTVSESGVPGYVAELWWGISAPPGLPAAILDRLNADINKIVGGDEMRKRFATEGAEPVLMSPSQTKDFVRSEIVRWRKVAEEAKLKLE